MCDIDDKVWQCCVLSRPWIKFQLCNLGVDHVVAGVPNGSWEHFNDGRFLHRTQISRQHYSRTKRCPTTTQLDSRNDYHVVLWGGMVPHACDLVTRPGFSWCLYWLRCVSKDGKPRQDTAQSNMSPSTADQLLVPEPLRWSRWKGDCTQLCSGLSQNQAPQNVCLISIFSWKRQFQGVPVPSVWNNVLWSSKVRAAEILAVWPMDEAGSCQVDLKPGEVHLDRKLITGPYGGG